MIQRLLYHFVSLTFTDVCIRTHYVLYKRKKFLLYNNGIL